MEDREIVFTVDYESSPNHPYFIDIYPRKVGGKYVCVALTKQEAQSLLAQLQEELEN